MGLQKFKLLDENKKEIDAGNFSGLKDAVKGLPALADGIYYIVYKGTKIELYIKNYKPYVLYE